MAKLTVSRFNDTAERQAHYLAEVDRLAEQVRGRYLTIGSGQSMTYEAKYLEALKGDGPFLRAEAQALGVTVVDVVSSVLKARHHWETIGAAIEAERLKAKRQIKLATDAGEMHQITKNLVFPTPTSES